MPYHIAHQKGKYYVVNEDTGEKRPAGGYKTKAEAQSYMSALYAHAGDEAKKDADMGAAIPSGMLSRTCDFVPVRSMREPEEIEGYLAIWGGPEQKDCYDTYFSKEEPPAMDLGFLPFPLRYAHGQDPTIGKDPIGKVVKVWLDDTGVAFRALLDKARAGYERIAEETRQGLLGVSTGVPDYLADFALDGRFVKWPIAADVSLTDKPCESRMPAVTAVRSRGEVFELEIKPVAPREAVTVDDPRDCSCDEQASSKTGMTQGSTKSKMRGNTMGATRTKKRAGAIPPKPLPEKDAQEGDASAGQEQENAPKRAGLTMQHLGLGEDATLHDIYEALCELLGDNAAEAVMEDVMGMAEEEGAEAIEPEDGEEMLMREDPESNDRPEEFMGDEEIEDITDGENDGSATGRSATLKSILRRAVEKQSRAIHPRSRKPVQTSRELTRLQAENKRMRQLLLNAPIDDVPTRRTDRRDVSNGGRNIRDMRDLRYDGQKASDLAFAIKLVEARHEQNPYRNALPSDSLYRATAYKIAHEIEKGTELGSDVTVGFFSPFRSRDDVMRMDMKALRRNYRAGEVMGDANTNFGSNYVGVFYDTSIWLKVRAMPIWRMLEARGMEEKVIPVGYASDVIPLEGADFTWYRVPETVDIDATGRPKINITPSKAGTSSTTLTVRTHGALVYYSVLLEEDSIVPMASELNRKAEIQAQEQIEYVLFNGDTATGTGNLNLKNGTVSASDVYNFTITDGMLKAAIISNSGAAARQDGSLSDLSFQLLLGLIGKANNYITGSDPTKLLYVVDPATGLAADRLPIFKTKDINSAATVENGHVKEVYGVDVVRSGQMSLADSTGYIDSVTPANNKYGRILLTRPDQWVIGFKRQLTFEFFRDVPGQSNGMTITLRYGLQTRDNTQAASATYGVTVS